MGEFKKVILADLLQEKGYIRGSFGSALKRPEMKSEGIPVYEQQHAIYNSCKFRFYIDEEKFQKLQRFQVQTNDLVISCSGTVGKVTIIRDDDPKGIISQALLILRANSKEILPEYLKFFFSSEKGYNSIISRSSGSVQVNISKRAVIEQIPLSLPDLEIQEKIVGILKSIDDKIRNNEKINRNLEEQAKAIFIDEFFDLDELPKGWTEGSLTDIADFLNGLAMQKFRPAEYVYLY
jgi:type I restriction enzyme S subunit